MIQCYNWENNRLQFTSSEGWNFDLILKGNRTIVNGASASGKTLLYTTLKDIADDLNSIKPYGADNIFLVTKDTIDKLYNQTNKLVIIDRAELLLTDTIVQFINQDGKNRYLLFMRKPMGIQITPNHIAELTFKNDTFRIEYSFHVGGWC